VRDPTNDYFEALQQAQVCRFFARPCRSFRSLVQLSFRPLARQEETTSQMQAQPGVTRSCGRRRLTRLTPTSSSPRRSLVRSPLFLSFCRVSEADLIRSAALEANSPALFQLATQPLNAAQRTELEAVAARSLVGGEKADVVPLTL
jgi:hypothetical protein